MLTMGDVEFNELMHWRDEPVIAAKFSGREENLFPVLIRTMFKDSDEQLKLAYKVVDIVDFPYRKVCAILLRYNVDMPHCS